MTESLIFLGAFLAYTGLGISNTLTWRGRFDRRLAVFIAMIVTAHVYGVWSHRYDWQIDQATRNGYTGFLIFHTALIAINVAAVVNERAGIWLHRLAFTIVSMGAIGATFRYDVVAIYRIPVLFVFFLTLFLSYQSFTSSKPAKANSVDFTV